MKFTGRSCLCIWIFKFISSEKSRVNPRASSSTETMDSNEGDSRQDDIQVVQEIRHQRLSWLGDGHPKQIILMLARTPLARQKLDA